MSSRLDVRGILERHGLWASRDRGQCFLVDHQVIERIADEATRAGEPTVIEIGPGLGALTAALLQRGRKVVGIEIDRGVASALATEVDSEALEILCEDARHTDLTTLSDQTPAVAGNLPYSVTTPLLLRLLAQREAIGATTVMIQKEVADRLLAPPNTKTYGSLTVLFRQYAEITRAFDVGPSAFWPQPSVRSTVLRVDWRQAPLVSVADPAHLERVVRAAFAQRRKTLRNSLSTGFAAELIRAVDAAGPIDLSRRAETLSLADFVQLADAVSACERRSSEA